MPAQAIDRRFEAAGAIAREAGILAARLFAGRDAETFTLKGHQDYCTEADLAVEQLIKTRLGEAFPEDDVFGEEGGGTFGDRTWVIDPIDGTANFARQIPHFCISIAFVQDGRIEIGAINQPVSGELFLARRGAGVTLNGTAIKVSSIGDIRQSTIELGWSTRRPMTDYVAMIGRLVATGAGFRRAGSGALGMAYVAAGRIEGYGELHINSWDVLAGLLMVQEAGGWANDFLAGNGLTGGNPILACTPALHEILTRITGIA